MLGTLQRQFLISFGVMGSVLAYLPVFLASRLESLSLVGLVMGTTGLAIICTPVLMTALADSRLQSRGLIAMMFGIASLSCFWQAVSQSFVMLLISHTVFAFFIWPITSLQDGLVFADNQQAQAEGRKPTPYHRVRVYGTIGFAMPLAGLYFLFDAGYDTSIALILGGLVCAIGAINALTLPRTGLDQTRRVRFHESEAADNKPAQHRLPTLAAASVLLRGPAILFCVCLFIAHVGNSAYYAYYPIYLEKTVGFAKQWIGPITMLGVILELGVMTSVGLMTAKFGLKWILVGGLCVMSARFAMLGLWPAQHVAVWTQVMHGITVVAIYVIPPIYLNALAGDHFRASIQGLYAMVVFGPSRIAGNVLGGVISDNDLPTMFNIVSGTTLLAILGLAIGMRLPKRDFDSPRDIPTLVEGD